MPKVRIHFSDCFDIAPSTLEAHGALDISLINDLPLFIDPFLLFNSTDPKYATLHEDMIAYLMFLRDKSTRHVMDRGDVANWFEFNEVKQTWLGFSRTGNSGSGPGRGFAYALKQSLESVFKDFGTEKITRGSHVEKACLITRGIGRDNISDLTTALIKQFLLRYSEAFAKKYLEPHQCKSVAVPRSYFNYSTESWAAETFYLPYAFGDYVILTPKNLLTKDATWINRPDMLGHIEEVISSVPDEQLRSQMNNYLYSRLSVDEKTTKKERDAQIQKIADLLVQEFPEVIEHYIRLKEDRGDQAASESADNVRDTESFLIDGARNLALLLAERTAFYNSFPNTLVECKARIEYLRDVIEHQGGYRLFYRSNAAVRSEKDLQLLFKLVWFGTISSVDAEVDNGQGGVDFSIARGAFDKTLVEFKLASNSKLKNNLKHQLEAYKVASRAQYGYKVIFYFSDSELSILTKTLRDLDLLTDPYVILIDVRNDKPSASNIR